MAAKPMARSPEVQEASASIGAEEEGSYKGDARSADLEGSSEVPLNLEHQVLKSRNLSTEESTLVVQPPESSQAATCDNASTPMNPTVRNTSESRTRLLASVYTPRGSWTARSSLNTSRGMDTARKRKSSLINPSTEGMLVEETKRVISKYEQTMLRLAGLFNEEKKVADAKEREKERLAETLRDLQTSSVAPANQECSKEQETIAGLKERVKILVASLDAAEKRSRECGHMLERIRASARRKELKIQHLKVIHDRVAADRDQAELNMQKAQNERLAEENKVFDLEADMEEHRRRWPQELAGLQRVVDKRREMLLQRSLWENRMQADIEAIQRSERERDLKTKLVINSIYSARAKAETQSVKEKAEEFEERLRRVEQSTGLHVDLRNVGEVVELIMRQKKIKDLQFDKVRGEARRAQLTEELRELHAQLWSLLNVPERSSKMLDEINLPVRRAEARAHKAARDVEVGSTLALKTKSWIRNLAEKLATIDVLVGNSRRNSGQQEVVASAAAAAPPVTSAATDDDLVRALESLENRLYRCLLISSAPSESTPESAHELKSPRNAKASLFSTPIASPRLNVLTSPKIPSLLRALTFSLLAENAPAESSATNEATFVAVLPENESHLTEPKPGKFKPSVRPKLAAVAAMLTTPRLAKARVSLTATSGQLSTKPPPKPRSPRRSREPEGSEEPNPQTLPSRARPISASQQKPHVTLDLSSIEKKSEGKAHLLDSPSFRKTETPGKSDSLSFRRQASGKLRGVVDLTSGKSNGLESPSFGRRRPLPAHPILQAATSQLQMLKPEQLEALALGQSTPRDVALDLLSRPGGNNWRLDQKIRHVKACFITGPTSDDANGSSGRPKSARVRRTSFSAKVLDDEKDVVLEREDIKQQSAKILDLLKVASEKWEAEEAEAEAERVKREDAAEIAASKASTVLQRLSRPKRPLG